MNFHFLLKAAWVVLLFSTFACQTPVQSDPKPVLGGAEPLSLMTGLLAGNGQYGYLDGQGDAARFYNPSSLALLPDGNLLALDRYNHRIRKISPEGGVSTYWGAGERGNRDGDAATGRLNQPIALLALADGAVVIADAQNHSIRKLSPDGQLSTLAGTGSDGYQEGMTLQVEFNWPADLAADSAGNLYIADRYNHAIRRLSPQGEVKTLAGNGEAGSEDGTGKKAAFNEPMGIVMGPDQALYVSDSQNNLIRRVTLQGEVTTYAGSGLPGSRDDIASKAEFRTPAGLDFDKQGNLYVADRLNHRIRVITPEKDVRSLGGNGKPGLTNGVGENAAFSYPFDLVVGQEGQLYVADYSNHALRVLRPQMAK